jgi:tRNA1(Val) A37 N6-methylase TrmN6
MGNDSFYTPKVLADKLIGLINRNNFQTVVDFCMGDGELLRAAESKWPDIQCSGSDISLDVINTAAENHKDWRLYELDFLNEDLRACSPLLQGNRRFDLILLNPPFSCLGGTVHEIEFEGLCYKVSTAMKFLLTSLEYLDENGFLYCILPSSVAYSKKDVEIWTVLERRFNISVLEQPATKYFKDATPNVVLVSLNDFSKKTSLKTITRMSLDFKHVNIFRGKLSMFQVPKYPGQVPLIHSTNLLNNKIVDLTRVVDKGNSMISGPAVLLPRVGKPLRSKPCVITEDETYVISDCIIAIKMANAQDAKRLLEYMLSNWELIIDLYQGTGAKYITVEKLTRFLNLDLSLSEFNSRKAI